MKVISGHLTATEKLAIKQMINLKFANAKTPKKRYQLSEENGVYTVLIQQNDRGLIPVPGSQKRLTTNKAVFTL